MIRVCKPDAPTRLQAGIARTAQDCTDYNAGRREFKFDKTIYGHQTVKDTLSKAQHDKCCFCEGRFKAHAYGDVEHYRPKSSVRQARRAKALYPGYFWLAYSWNNLFWCCQICNRTHKKEFFPLIDPAKRARAHKDNLAIEKPLLLNPCGLEDPRNHIKFRGNLAWGVTKRGRTTIEIVGLNRPTLTEERLTHLKKIRVLWDITQVLNGKVEPTAAKVLKNAQNELDAAVQPTAKYSAMAADFLLAVSSAKAP